MGSGDILPTDLGAEAADIAHRMELLHFALEGRIAQYTETGISEAQVGELDAVSRTLEGIGTIATRGMDAIDDTEFDVIDDEKAIDEDETFDVVRRYVDRLDTSPFSAADLKAHLRNLGIRVPEDGRTFASYFRNWREDIQADKAEAGEPLVWVDYKEKGVKFFALAEIVQSEAETIAPVFKPPVVPVPAEPEITALVTIEPEAPVAPAHEILALQLIGTHPHMKANKVVQKLAASRTLGLTLHEASTVFKSLVTNGRLHRYRREGSLYYTLDAPSASGTTVAERGAGKEKRPAGLSDSEKALSREILRIYLAPGTQTNMKLSPQQIINELGETDPNREIHHSTVKRIARTLSAQGIMTFGKGRRGTGVSHSRGQEVAKIGIASQRVKDILKSDDPGQIWELIENGENFNLDEL